MDVITTTVSYDATTSIVNATGMQWMPPGQFYQDLHVAGVVPEIVALLGVKLLIGLIGIVLNLQLAWVTYRTRSLHGVCNILIAMNAFCTAIYQLSFVISFAVVVDGRNLISLQLCYWLQLVPVFMKYFTLTQMIFIGIDRLKSVLMPRWNTTNPLEYIYVAAGLAICTGFSIYVLIISYQVVQIYPDTLVMCSASEISQKQAGGLTFTSAMVLNFASVGVYCVLWIVLRFAKKSRNLKMTRKVFKSLYVIMVIEFIGWGSNSVYQFLQSLFWSTATLTPLQKWDITQVIGYLLCVATAVNGPVLYFCSKEYRRAYEAHFRALRHAMNPNATQEMSQHMFSTGNQSSSTTRRNSRRK